MFTSFTINRFSAFLFLNILFTTVAFGQNNVSSRLEQRIQEEPGQFHTIRIEFVHTVDLNQVKQGFSSVHLSSSKRVKRLISLLQEQATATQSTALRILKGVGEAKVKAVYPFWITNLIVAEVKEDVIFALAQTPNVSHIDLEESVFVPHDPILAGVQQKTASIGGTEPGLVAINAPAMWAMGYTGRGRLVYNYDTGVWPTHPSFTDRFMANFYPLSQSWYGFFSETPNGNVADHGTHTLGTIAGLDTTNSDTIGVAFEAYWMANDFVTSTVAGLPPLVNMIDAFQWALNPDGDTSTTHDVPDVINNSWRWYDVGDTVHCGGFVVDLMNAIEAAGIANVFSGGNFGPSNTTISSPQRINTTEINTFSVGSVNANQSFPYPISSFSSKGPTQCPGTGSLSIHPEVVAPGQNVRSAWGKDGYNSISGTSMAAPHVSGAVLLLKEAFPYLTGDTLLYALYVSAIDMGATGEDNIYGRGLIDVFAAYQYLAQRYTPVDPKQIAWDLSIVDLSLPTTSGISCDADYNPEIKLLNKGDSTITKINFEYNVNNGSYTAHSWTGVLLPGQSVTLNLPAVSFAGFGDQELEMQCSIEPVQTEYDAINNRRNLRFNRRASVALPFTEGFEQGISSDWLIMNEDGALSWDTLSVSGRGANQIAAHLPFYNYHPRSSQYDGLISPELAIPATGISTLKFDVSYQRLNSFSQLQDTLRVYASTDCGLSFPHLLYEKYGSALSTNDTSTKDFIPLYESHWRRDSVDLQSLAGQDVLLQITGVNRKGNNLYIDNISVYAGANDPISIPEEREIQSLSLFPNPATKWIKLEIPTEETMDLSFFDVRGKRVKQIRNYGSDTKLSVVDLPTGMYWIEASDTNKKYRSWLVKR